MTNNREFAGYIRSSTLASSLLLLISFLIPFIWGLSTSLVWDIGKNMATYASDIMIAYPSGISIILIMLSIWLAVFWLLQFFIESKLIITLIANLFAIISCGVQITLQFDTMRWNFIPDESGMLNIFPYRIIIASVSAFICSLWLSILLSRKHHS